MIKANVTADVTANRRNRTMMSPERRQMERSGQQSSREMRRGWAILSTLPAKRRAAVLARTQTLMDRMDAAGNIVSANVLLHLQAAQAVVDSLNATGAIVGDLHVPLGIDTNRVPLRQTRWRDAARDPQQLKRAGGEVAKGAALVGGAAATVVVGVAARNGSQKGS